MTERLSGWALDRIEEVARDEGDDDTLALVAEVREWRVAEVGARPIPDADVSDANAVQDTPSEPAAWAVEWHGRLITGTYTAGAARRTADLDGGTVVPLYRHPAPATDEAGPS